MRIAVRTATAKGKKESSYVVAGIQRAGFLSDKEVHLVRETRSLSGIDVLRTFKANKEKNKFKQLNRLSVLRNQEYMERFDVYKK